MKNNAGIIAVFILMGIPLILWLSMLPLADRFGSFVLTARSIGQITGLLGMTLFALNIILSARLKFLEDYFAGLSQIYIKHHLLGGICLILLLIHPISLSFVNLTYSVYEAARFLLPTFSRLDIFFGIISLLLMIFLLFLTFFARPAYHIWKITHKFLALAFLLVFFHILLVSSDISGNVLLRYYLWFLSFLAFVVIVYRTLFHRSLVRHGQYILAKMIEVGDNVTELTLIPKNESVTFLPGQFAFLAVKNSSFSAEEHPFSIVSTPTDPNLKFLVKNSGDYTSEVKQIPLNSEITIEGPFGRFSYLDFANRQQIWIAGGIGITPFLSMARDLKNKNRDYVIDLYYSGHTSEELIFLNELKIISRQIKSFRFFPFNSAKQGRITASYIADKSEQVVQKDIFICGPKPMMESLRKQFVKIGVPNRNIHTEEFEL